MAKRKITSRVVSHGIYNGWDGGSKDLPKIEKSGDTIPARVDTEFGYILNIKGARGKVLEFTIEHPPFMDENDQVVPAFKAELYVRTNDWSFFLGDKVWEPVEDKMGDWRLITAIEGTVLEDRTFTVERDSWW